jgi:5'-nucleotidase (lipoprotein e(P4) family)
MSPGGEFMKRGVTSLFLGSLLLSGPVMLAQIALPACSPATCSPRPPEATRSLEVKYVRDSAEYATLCRQVYRAATTAVTARHGAGAWGVILDVDETTLDNSVFQLDRVTYGLTYDDASWAAWVQRAEAGSVPGVKDFLDAVRAAGGKVVFITDRFTEYVSPDGKKIDMLAATRENLVHNELMKASDLLCLKTAPTDTKANRRAAVAGGSGACSWSGTKVDVVAFIGDQLGDFPQSGEAFPGSGMDAEFGHSFFLLPDPMYGKWTNGVTRTSGSFK